MNKPILFNTEMVRTIQSGAKTVTRRLVKPEPAGDKSKPEPLITRPGYWNTWGDDNVYRQPYQMGDMLWVRETWTVMRDIDTGHEDYFFAAIQKDLDTVSATYLCDDDGFDTGRPFPWKPSIHMPKWIARLFLRVKDVRVERLQDITEEQAHAEGCCTYEDKIGDGKFLDVSEFDLTARDAFAALWDTTIKPADLPRYGWDANPWVWVVEFERCDKPDGWEATP